MTNWVLYSLSLNDRPIWFSTNILDRKIVGFSSILGLAPVWYVVPLFTTSVTRSYVIVFLFLISGF